MLSMSLKYKIKMIRSGHYRKINFISYFLTHLPILYGIAWSEIFIEPPPYAQQRRRRGERGTGVTKGS
jgi:hypothetical protein